MDDAGLNAITRLRYAKVLLASGDTAAALAEANNEMPSSFEPSQQELLGDIYVMQGDKEAAVKSYNNAWELLRARHETRAVLALKMESLGVVPEPITDQAPLIQASTAPDTSSNTVNSTESDSSNIAEQVAQ